MKSKQPLINYTYGFTLVELLIVIAIIGILAGFGISSFVVARFESQAARDRLSLLHLPVLLEAHFAGNGQYPDELDEVIAPGAGGVHRTTGKIYEIGYVSTGGTNYVLSATLDDASPHADKHTCHELQVDSAGVLSAQDENGNDVTGMCWRQ